MLSGLCTLTKEQLNSLKNNEEFQLVTIQIIYKTMYYLFSSNHEKDSLAKKISNCFLILDEYGKISKDPSVDLFFRNNWFSIIQHFLNLFSLNKKFDIQILSELAPGMDLTFCEKKHHISFAIELFTLSRNINIRHYKPILWLLIIKILY